MQLFSVGLWKLHRNGTYVLDAQGSPLVTYTTDDVVTLSRAWTGFTRQAARTNLENYYGNTLVSTGVWHSIRPADYMRTTLY